MGLDTLSLCSERPTILSSPELVYLTSWERELGFANSVLFPEKRCGDAMRCVCLHLHALEEPDGNPVGPSPTERLRRIALGMGPGGQRYFPAHLLHLGVLCASHPLLGGRCNCEQPQSISDSVMWQRGVKGSNSNRCEECNAP